MFSRGIWPKTSSYKKVAKIFLSFPAAEQYLLNGSRRVFPDLHSFWKVTVHKAVASLMTIRHPFNWILLGCYETRNSTDEKCNMVTIAFFSRLIHEMTCPFVATAPTISHPPPSPDVDLNHILIKECFSKDQKLLQKEKGLPPCWFRKPRRELFASSQHLLNRRRPWIWQDLAGNLPLTHGNFVRRNCWPLNCIDPPLSQSASHNIHLSLLWLTIAWWKGRRRARGIWCKWSNILCGGRNSFGEGRIMWKMHEG